MRVCVCAWVRGCARSVCVGVICVYVYRSPAPGPLHLPPPLLPASTNGRAQRLTLRPRCCYTRDCDLCCMFSCVSMCHPLPLCVRRLGARMRPAGRCAAGSMHACGTGLMLHVTAFSPFVIHTVAARSAVFAHNITTSIQRQCTARREVLGGRAGCRSAHCSMSFASSPLTPLPCDGPTGDSSTAAGIP